MMRRSRRASGDTDSPKRSAEAEAAARLSRFEAAKGAPPADALKDKMSFRWLVVFALHSGVEEKEAITRFVVKQRRRHGLLNYGGSTDEEDDARCKRTVTDTLCKEYRSNTGWWELAEAPASGRSGPYLYRLTPLGKEQLCGTCGGDDLDGNPLIFCDAESCCSVHHLQCANPPLSKVPEGQWYCTNCLKDNDRCQVHPDCTRGYEHHGRPGGCSFETPGEALPASAGRLVGRMAARIAESATASKMAAASKATRNLSDGLSRSKTNAQSSGNEALARSSGGGKSSKRSSSTVHSPTFTAEEDEIIQQLYGGEGLSWEEIAERIGRSPQDVSMRWRRKLRYAWYSQGGGASASKPAKEKAMRGLESVGYKVHDVGVSGHANAGADKFSPGAGRDTTRNSSKAWASDFRKWDPTDLHYGKGLRHAKAEGGREGSTEAERRRSGRARYSMRNGGMDGEVGEAIEGPPHPSDDELARRRSWDSSRARRQERYRSQGKTNGYMDAKSDGESSEQGDPDGAEDAAADARLRRSLRQGLIPPGAWATKTKGRAGRDGRSDGAEARTRGAGGIGMTLSRPTRQGMTSAPGAGPRRPRSARRMHLCASPRGAAGHLGSAPSVPLRGSSRQANGSSVGASVAEVIDPHANGNRSDESDGEDFDDYGVIRIGPEYQAVCPEYLGPLDDADHGEGVRVAQEEPVPGVPTLVWPPPSRTDTCGVCDDDNYDGGLGRSVGNVDPDVYHDMPGSEAERLSRFFLFPLPPPVDKTPTSSFRSMYGGEGPSRLAQLHERKLKFRLEQLGFTHLREPLPPQLETPPLQWTSAEAALFGERLSRLGKRFREFLPEFPGRSMSELVEAYYCVHKSHKHLSKIDARQASRNVREGMCCTVGCMLHHNHGGLHLFEEPLGPRVRRAKVIRDATE